MAVFKKPRPAEAAPPRAVPAAPANDTEGLLHAIEIFTRLSRRQIGRLARVATYRSFTAGTRILRRGDTGVALYLIVQGRVAVTLPSEEGGTERLLSELEAGQVFGEMALIDASPRSAHVTALEPTECLVLTRWDFAHEMRKDPEIAQALLPVLCARLRGLQERLIHYEAEGAVD